MDDERQIEIGRDAIGNTLITGDGNVVVIQATHVLAEEEPEPTAIGPNPYKGLSAFDENDADRFFGREALTDKLWKLFRSLHEPPPGAEPPLRLLPVLGPSGSGKSSLVRAGLIPELARRPLAGLDKPRVAVFTPGAHPTEALAAVLARIATYDSTPVAKTREFADELRRTNPQGAYDGLRRIADAMPDIATSPLIVLVDQFEETYSLCWDAAQRSENAEERSEMEAECNAFVENLLHAAGDRRGRVSVILTLRSDFLGATGQHPRLNRAIADRGVIVPAMGEDELRRAIAEPARQAGHPIDEATVELLVSETQGREGALPLLQFALTRIWDGLAKGKSPAETLKELGGVGGALAGEAERLYSQLTESQKQIARRAFLSLVRLGEGMRDTRRRASVSEMVAEGDTREDVLEVLRAFSRPGERLITLSAEDDQGVSAEVAHEALFDHWGQLREWLAGGSRDDIRFHRRLAEAARHWDKQKRPDGLLWRPPDLDLLEKFHKRLGQDMTTVQVEFYRVSQSREQRRRLIKGVTVSALVLLLAAAVGFGSYAEYHRRAAVQSEKFANAQRDKALRTQSLFLADLSRQQTAAGYATTGILLALEALPTDLNNPGRPYVAQAETALYRAVAAPGERLILHGHEDEVDHAAFSPDGERLVTASEDDTARLWNVKTGKPLAVLKGHESDVTHAAFSPDGGLLVTASGDATARLWDVKTGKPLAVLEGHEGWIIHAAFSPDGELLVTTSEDKTARFWNAKTGKPLALLRGHEGYVYHAAFSPDGERLVTTSGDKTARFWNTKTGESLALLKGHEDSVFHAAFSPDGERLVTASEDKTARLWSVKTGKPLAVLKDHEDSVTHAAFSPDGARLATASHDKTARLWSAKTGKPLAVLKGHEGGVRHAAFSPDGERLVTTSGDKTARLWNTKTGETLAVLKGHEDGLRHAAFSPDGQHLVTASIDNTARLWYVKTGVPLTVLKGHSGGLSHAAFSPDGERLVTTSRDKTARLWSAKTGVPLAVLKGHAGGLSHAAFSPDGERLVTASEDKTARLWNVKTGETLAVLKGHEDGVRHAAFSPDGERLVTASYDKTARLWNIKTGETLAVLKGDNKGTLTHTAFSPDGARIVTTSWDHTARLWSAKTGESLVVLKGHTYGLRHAAFSPDGERLVTASGDDTARLWNVKTGELIAILKDHWSDVVHAAFSPDGERLVTASEDKTARLWNAKTGVPLTVLKGHEEGVIHAAFSPDGERLVTASEDKMARLWNAKTGVPLAVLKGHEEGVTHAAFSPDGERLVTASEDKTARLWSVLPKGQELIEYAQHIVPRELRPDERKRFFLSENSGKSDSQDRNASLSQRQASR